MLSWQNEAPDTKGCQCLLPQTTQSRISYFPVFLLQSPSHQLWYPKSLGFQKNNDRSSSEFVTPWHQGQCASHYVFSIYMRKLGLREVKIWLPMTQSSQVPEEWVQPEEPQSMITASPWGQLAWDPSHPQPWPPPKLFYNVVTHSVGSTNSKIFHDVQNLESHGERLTAQVLPSSETSLSSPVWSQGTENPSQSSLKEKGIYGLNFLISSGLCQLHLAGSKGSHIFSSICLFSWQ